MFFPHISHADLDLATMLFCWLACSGAHFFLCLAKLLFEISLSQKLHFILLESLATKPVQHFLCTVRLDLYGNSESQEIHLNLFFWLDCSCFLLSWLIRPDLLKHIIPYYSTVFYLPTLNSASSSSSLSPLSFLGLPPSAPYLN